MRLNWMISYGNVVSMSDIQSACAEFYSKHQVVADTIKLTYKDFSMFLSMMHQPIQTLERGKDYGLFIAIPGGMVELCLMEDDHESMANMMQGFSIMAVESSFADREFEKHVLNKDT